MLQITKQISAYNHSANNPIAYIVCHDTGNQDDTPEGNANYFSADNRNASAHYFVGDTSIVQVVEDINAAWHCGDGNNAYGINNHNSLGIEMCNTNGQITEVTEVNMLDLVYAKMIEHNVPTERVVRHYDASRKNCPEPWSANNWAKWNEFKKRLNTKGDEFKMDVCVVYFTLSDFSSALILSQLNGNCGMFCRNGSPTVNSVALKATKIIVVGGPKLGVIGEIYLSGNSATDTLVAVSNYLQKK